MSAKTDIERLRTIRSRMAEIIKGFNVVKNICYTRNKYLAVPHIKDYIQQLENDLFNIKILLDEVRSFVVGVIIFDFCKDDNEAAKQRNAFIDEYNSVNDIFLEIDETLYKIYQKNFDENSYKVIIDICDGIIKSCKIIEEYGLKVREQLISMLNSI